MNVASSKFQIFAYSETKAGKEKCGDAFTVLEIKEEKLVVLAVADGVSSCPCDWLASKIACDTVNEVFVESQENYTSRMINAAKQAHLNIHTTSGSCRGMLTSLSLAVWDMEYDEVCVLNVGDSRIYLGPETDLRQITQDDTTSILVKRSGSVLFNDGMPVFMRGVTRSLGQREPLSYAVKIHKFTKNDVLILVSDGISKDELFTSELKHILGENDLCDRLLPFVRSKSEKNMDDATLVILRLIEKD